MNMYHETLTAGRWQEFSLAEQLGNIGSEVGRARTWKEKDIHLFQGAVDRAFELFDLTIQDPRWRKRLREIIRARESLCDAIEGGKRYGSSLEALERYFFFFALFARLRK